MTRRWRGGRSRDGGGVALGAENQWIGGENAMMWKIGLAKTGKSVYICSIEPFADGRCKWL